MKGFLFRSEKPVRVTLWARKGGAGIRVNLRSYHKYALKPKGSSKIQINGEPFISYGESLSDKKRASSKAKIVLRYLKQHQGKAFFSKEIAKSYHQNQFSTAADLPGNVHFVGLAASANSTPNHHKWFGR